MNSPFEELEFLSDYLPDEGESVVVSRQDGELVCRSYRQEPPTRDPLDDPVLYGRLVQANERLRGAAARPIWWSVSALYLGCVAIHLLTAWGWYGVVADVGLALLLLQFCVGQIRREREMIFRTEIRPMLTRIFRQHRAERYTVLGATRQRPELHSICAELARWCD